MITDITIGQYFPGDSVVHKMDSRMKIILTVLLIVAIFICKTLPALGVIVVATIALVLISKIPLKTVFKSIKPLAILFCLRLFLIFFTARVSRLFKFGSSK